MPDALAQRTAAVRRFNRFYTRQIGVLRKTYLDSPYSLGEMRVLYEIAHGAAPTATDIGRALELDAGYLSRVLQKFEKRGLITRKTSKRDARQSHLALTARGRRTFTPHEQRSQRDVAAMLGRLKPDQQVQLVSAVQTIETLLDNKPDAGKTKPAYVLRAPRHGDFGWIVSRHAELYAQEYGWGDPFEGLCAQIVADFVNNYDAERERCWIAETGRRERRHGYGGEGLRRGGAAAPAAGRPEGARPGARPAPGRRMRLLRAASRLQEDDAMDAQHSGRRAALLPERRLHPHLQREEVSWGKDVVAEYWDLEL